MSFIPYDLNDDKLKKIQLQGLKWTVGHAYNNSPFYKKKLDDAGLKPEDIRLLEDIEHLPLIDKDDLQQEYPFPLRAVPFAGIRSDLVRCNNYRDHDFRSCHPSGGSYNLRGGRHGKRCPAGGRL